MYTLFFDSDCDITLEDVKKYHAKLISMPYVVDGEEVYPYVDFEKFDEKEFYGMLRRGVLPSTCALSEENYRQYFEPELEQDSTKGAEIDALRGIGQALLGHVVLPFFDDGLIDEGREKLGLLALDDERLHFGRLIGDGGDGAAKIAIEVLQRVAVLLAGLLGVLALAELDPVFIERGRLLRLLLLGAGQSAFKVLE